jgi:WD40 repeat protein
MSISCEDNNIKLWNAHNWECLLNLKQIYYKGFLFSACFLHLNNDIFIITSNNNTKITEDFSEPIKIYDISGNFIKEVEESYLKSFFIESYLDYIITGNNGYLKSYNFQENKTYQIYRDKTDNSFYSNVNTIKDKDVIKIIEFYVGGLIRIWNFHLGILLNKIKLDHAIFGNCLWNKEYILVGCYNGTIELIELKSGKKYGIYEGHNCTVINVNKIIHPLYGECIISQGIGKDKIKFLINNN